MTRTSRSLRTQILLYLFLTAFFSSLVTEAIIIEKSRRSLLKFLDQTAEAYAKGLASLAEVEKDGEVQFEFADEIMPDFSSHKHQAYFLVIRISDFKEIERSESMGDVDISLPISIHDIKVREPVYWDASIGKNKIRFVALREFVRLDTTPSPSNPEPGPHSHSDREFLFVVGLNKEYIAKRLEGTVEATVPALATGLLLMLFFVWFAVHRNLKPLLKLEQEVELISPTNISSVTIPEVKEVARVAQTLNRMIDDLKAAFERERRFSSNVAHELRTRIGEMRTTAEVALRAEDIQSEQDKENYRDILASAKEMQDIVINLLMLARCQSGQLKPQKDSVTVKSLIETIWKDLASDADARRITLAGTAPPDLCIMTDREFLRLILHNLFSNAISHAPEGGVVEWKADRHDNEFTISISNPAQNLSPDDLPHLFEPFWKKDEVRTSGNSHSGLGLSLAQSLSEILGFTIDARLTTPSRVTMIVSGKTDRTGQPCETVLA